MEMLAFSGGTCIVIIITCLLTQLDSTTGNPQFSFGRIFTAPDSQLTTPQMIKKYGYPVEIQQVVTEDGYVLTMHRIPYSRNGTGPDNRPAVFLQHGLFSTSADWVLPGPENGLAYYLSDAGYDVWLGNFRGDTYSRKHQKLTPQDSLFWDFSIHELGIYDLRAMIDHVLAETGQSSLFFVGHSMGATAFFALASSLPEYNAKLRVMFAVSPGGLFSKDINALFRLSIFSRVGAEAEKSYNIEFAPITIPQKIIVQIFCNDGLFTQQFCQIPFNLFELIDSKQLNKTLIPVILSHIPAGSSLKLYVHVGQLIRSGKFQQYDHGPELNVKYYGSLEPPSYDFSKVTVPVSLHVGRTDHITPVEAIERMEKALPNTVGVFIPPLPSFRHYDFIWGVDAKKVFYPLLISIMNRY